MMNDNILSPLAYTPIMPSNFIAIPDPIINMLCRTCIQVLGKEAAYKERFTNIKKNMHVISKTAYALYHMMVLILM